MFRYIIQAIANGLSFSKTEARGTFALAVLILLVMVGSKLAMRYSQNTEYENSDSAQLVAWVNEVEKSIRLKPKASKEPPKVAHSSTDSKVRRNAARSKIYEKKAEVLEITYDLNTATAVQLREIKGIGPAYSERIIKYRTLLGGFAELDQLGEVYGLSPELIERISSRFEIQSKPSPFDINSDSARLLANHPYISYDQAWTIINYRKQHGEIRGVDDLAKIKSFSDSLLLKLRPYLK